MSKIRCKFVVESITESLGWFQNRTPQRQACKAVKMRAVSAQPGEVSENAQYQQYTPSGTFEAVIDNPAVIDQLRPGCEFYIDLVPVPELPTTA